jgi:DNA invertase Pin-like site-specific DNA recombinase
MDGYIRVSRTGDRSGEAYRSPGIQREAIERWARQEGVELGRVTVEEDVSGGKAVKERGLEQLLRRCEAGASAGVIVFRVDRFGRDLAETVLAVKRLKDADARLVAVSDGFDSSQPMGAVMLGIFAGLAEVHLDSIRGNWRAATEGAVSAGIHIAARAPLGYLRRDRAAPTYDARGNLIRNGRLVPDPATAEHVRRAFELRADGASHQKIADHLRATTGHAVVKSTVVTLLRNHAYLGEARGPGGLVQAGAHEPLVPEDLFLRVQPRGREGIPPRRGSLARQARLAGLVRCAGCGNLLRIVGSTARSGREASYVCASKYTSGDCPAPAAARVRLVDEHVAERLAGAFEDVVDLEASAERRFLEAREAVSRAQAALDAWVDDAELSAALGREAFRRGILARQAALEEARRALWALDDPGVNDAQLVVWVDGKPYPYERWGEDPEADRRLLRKHVADVRLRKADPRRRKWEPIAERVTVRWVGED